MRDCWMLMVRLFCVTVQDPQGVLRGRLMVVGLVTRTGSCG